MCRSSGGNASAWVVEVEPVEPEEEREIQHVWALSVCDISAIPWDVMSVCDNSDLPSDESGNLVNMIADSGVPWCRWQTGSLGELLLKPAQVRFRSATGDDMGVSGSLWCVDGAIIKWWSWQLWWRLELPSLSVQQRNRRVLDAVLR